MVPYLSLPFYSAPSRRLFVITPPRRISSSAHFSSTRRARVVLSASPAFAVIAMNPNSAWLVALLLGAVAVSVVTCYDIALPPVDDYVNCTEPIVAWSDHSKWARYSDQLFFQANGAREKEETHWQMLSDRLECPGPGSCTLSVTSVRSYAHSLSWGASVRIGYDFWKIVTFEASAYFNMTTAHETGRSTSYSCTVPANTTAWLAIRVQYYEVFGYVAEWLDGQQESVLRGDKVYPTSHYGWTVPCRSMLRTPKISPDGSISGVRRCVVAGSREEALEKLRVEDERENLIDEQQVPRVQGLE